MPKPRTYVPKAYVKEVLFKSTGGSCLKLEVNVGQMKTFLDAHENTKGTVKLEISKLRMPTPTGCTHAIYLDTFVPVKRAGKVEPELPVEDEKVPF
jgi:hypothetical protein